MTASGERPARLLRVARFVHSPVLAWGVLALAVGLSIAAWQVSRHATQNTAAQRFDFRTAEIQHAIEDRMLVYEQVLWGGAALFNASDEVLRDEWRAYGASLDLDAHWPGIQGLGYAVPLTSDEIDDHVAAIRAEGFPDYAIRPEGARAQYAATLMLEPFDWRNQRAFGFDMWSNEVRREAMVRARDTGRAATSGPITLVQETDEDVQRGFLTYVPVYREGVIPSSVEERRSMLQGWVYAPFRMGDLMTGILGSGVDDVAYEIFDGSELSAETLLYDSNATFAGGHRHEGVPFTDTVEITVQGRPWMVVFEASEDYVTGSEVIQPTLIAIGGLIINLLLFYVIWSLGLLEKRATAMAEEKAEALNEASVALRAHAAELERSNAELGQFAYVAAHDLQEPLRNLGSYSGLLAEKHNADFDDESRRWFGYIENSAERMSTLLRELLDYARLDVADEDIEATRVPLSEAARHAVGHLATSIEESGATVVIPDELPVVAGDPLELERLFQNLIANAIKYRSPDRAPAIVVRSVADGGRWRISVHDNGMGIKPQYHERVFEIFRRVSGPRDRSGTGIGLAVCRKIVHRHGGTIGVVSEFGEGSEFWFTLPRVEQSAESRGVGQPSRLAKV